MRPNKACIHDCAARGHMGQPRRIGSACAALSRQDRAELGATDHFIALILETQSFDRMLWLSAGSANSPSAVCRPDSLPRSGGSLSTGGSGRHRRLARVLPIPPAQVPSG